MAQGRQIVTLAGFALLLFPTRALAQFEGLLGSVNDVNFFFSCWHTRSEIKQKGDCPVGKNGYGLEVSFDVGDVRLPGSRKHLVKEGRWNEQTREVTTGDRERKTVTTYTWEEPQEEESRSLALEAALGYSQFSGFKSKVPGVEIEGTAREFPSVAVYGTFDISDVRFLRVITPYIGVKSGFIELANVQAYTKPNVDSVDSYTAAAKAFQLGGIYGIVLNISRFHLFVERSHNLRRFANVQWDGPIKGKIPDTIPRTFDFSGPTVSMGVQITIKTK